MLDRKFLRWCAVLAAGSASAAIAQSLPQAAQPWVVQAWGQPAAQFVAMGSDDCGAAGRESGFLFIKKRTAGGADVEVIMPSVLKPGTTYELTVPIRAEGVSSAVGVDVFFRRDSPYYETAAIKTVHVTGQWQTVTLRGVYDSAKPGSVRIALRRDGTGICLGQPTLREIEPERVAPDDRLHPVSPYFFGIHLNKLGVHSGWPSFEPDVVRMWSTGTQWSEMQPNPAEIDWRKNIHAQRLDYFVNHTGRHSGTARILMTLGMTPPWASSPSGDGGACEQSAFGRRTCMAPSSMDAWRHFVRHLAQRFKGRIRLWEVWNEADVPTHWVGGVPMMVEMVRIAAEETKKVDPASKLIGPNVTPMGLRFLNEFLALGGGRYVDGLSIHLYAGGAPWNMLSRTRNVIEMTRAHGLDLPIWNTESNTACGGGPDADVVLQQNLCSIRPEAAIAQAVIGSAALGVENLSYYTWEGAELHVGGTGLVEGNFRTLTKAGLLYDRLADLLKGASVRFMPPVQQGVSRVELVTKSGKRCVVAWTNGHAATLSAELLRRPAVVRTVDGLKVEAKDKSEAWVVNEMPVLACGS